MKIRNLKRFAALILALVLALGTLAGCGSSSSEDSADDTDAAQTEAEADDTDAAGETDVTVITAVTGGSTRPYVYVDENDEVTGYDAEVLKAVFERLDQYELEWVVTDYSSLFAGITSGIYQIAVNNFSYNDERAQSYLFSYPYNKLSYVFVTKNGAEHITSFEEAAGKSIENGTGISVSVAIEEWNEQNPDLAIDLQYSDADMAVWLQHIEDGTIDFNIVNKAMYEDYVAEYGFDLQADAMSDEDQALLTSNLCSYYLFNLDDTELRDEVNAVLKEMKEDGTLAEISEEWFGEDSTPDDEQFEYTLN